MPKYASCRCGATWHQRGNHTGHCSECHETFESIGAFDAHQHMQDRAPYQTCADPAGATQRSGEPLFARAYPLAQPSDAWSWRLTPSQKQREALERLKERRNG